MNDLEKTKIQETIIRMQSNVIDELFLELCKYMSAEQIDGLPVINKINLIAEIRN